MANEKVAVVTGGNKGIGFAIVKGLIPLFKGTIYLTARNEELGRKAVQELSEISGAVVRFHQLDIDDDQSIHRFADHIKQEHGGLDVLINNAAILIKNKDPKLYGQEVADTVRVNYTANLNVCNALFPLLRPHSRVVNVSSKIGLLKFMADEAIREKLKSPDLTISYLDSLAADFVKAAHEGNERKYVDNEVAAYSFSKILLTALTRIQQREIDLIRPSDDVVISSCSPGYVDTDMTNHQGLLTPDQGAETPIYLALLPDNFDGPRGLMWFEKKTLDWTDITLDVKVPSVN